MKRCIVFVSVLALCSVVRAQNTIVYFSQDGRQLVTKSGATVNFRTGTTFTNAATGTNSGTNSYTGPFTASGATTEISSPLTTFSGTRTTFSSAYVPASGYWVFSGAVKHTGVDTLAGVNTLSGATASSGGLSVTGGLTGSSQITNSGYTQLTGGFETTGADTFAGTVRVTGAITSTGLNGWSAENTFTDTISASGKILSTGANTWSGAQGVTGAITSSGLNQWSAENTFTDTLTATGKIISSGANSWTGGNTATGEWTFSDTVKFGDGSNYAMHAADGTLELIGNATLWEDIRIVPGNFDRPGNSDPAYVEWRPGNGAAAIYTLEFAVNDSATFFVQTPHSRKNNSDLSIHIHWTAGTRGNEEANKAVGWKVGVSWADIGEAFGTVTYYDLSDTTSGTDHVHQMTSDLPITGTNKGTSSMLACSIKRTDTGTDDTWSSSTTAQLPLLLEVDFHYEVDTPGGSRGIHSK
jgi:hypothetical protein